MFIHPQQDPPDDAIGVEPVAAADPIVGHYFDTVNCMIRDAEKGDYHANRLARMLMIFERLDPDLDSREGRDCRNGIIALVDLYRARTVAARRLTVLAALIGLNAAISIALAVYFFTEAWSQ